MVSKEDILGTLEDTISNFLYYDRKEDEDLPRGAIEEALAAGEITIGDMVTYFEVALRQGLRDG